jgi:hypothetical protein
MTSLVTPKFAPLSRQPGEPTTAIPAGPASGGTESYALVASQAGQREARFQGRPQEVKPLEGQGTLGLREAAERRLCHRRERSSGTAKIAVQRARGRMQR